jgi:hypothetical protein
MTYFGAIVRWLEHDRRVTELLNETVLALDGYMIVNSDHEACKQELTGIRDLGDFITLEPMP